MSNKIPQEEWTPLPFMEGEHALSKIEYNATDLLVELDSFKENRVTKLFCKCVLIQSNIRAF